MIRKTLATKFVAVALSSILIMSAAACGNDGSSGSQSSAGGSVDSKEESGEAPEESGEDSAEESEEASSGEEENASPIVLHEPKDLNGRTIKICLWWDEYWDSNYQTLEDIDAAGGSYADPEIMQMKLDKIREIEERWNCRIEWVNIPWGDVKESINISGTNGTPEYDIYALDQDISISPVLNGYLMSYKDYAPADSDIMTNQIVLMPYSVLGYDEYFLHSPKDDNVPEGAQYMVYNASVLDAKELEAPEKLAERGEWTWEKFAEYALACTEDVDGDGVMDTYGYGGSWASTIEAFTASNNATIASGPAEGLSDTKTIEALDFIRRLYQVDKSAVVPSGDWYQNNATIYGGTVAFACQQPWQLINADGAANGVRVCPLPTGPSGDGSLTMLATIKGWGIPKGVEDPESVYLILEEMMNWFNGDIEYRDEASWFESAFADADQLEVAYREGLKNNIDWWQKMSDMSSIMYPIYEELSEGDATAAQLVESNKQLVQDVLDGMFGGGQ